MSWFDSRYFSVHPHIKFIIINNYLIYIYFFVISTLFPSAGNPRVENGTRLAEIFFLGGKKCLVSSRCILRSIFWTIFDLVLLNFLFPFWKLAFGLQITSTIDETLYLTPKWKEVIKNFGLLSKGSWTGISRLSGSLVLWNLSNYLKKGGKTDGWV